MRLEALEPSKDSLEIMSGPSKARNCDCDKDSELDLSFKVVPEAFLNLLSLS